MAEEEGEIPALGKEMRVWLVGRTTFTLPPEAGWFTAKGGAKGRWTSDAASDGEALIEFAGRACYESWSKPNPATAHNPDYVAHILEVGHLSVIEHAIATFYITGVSRALTHELVRHRHFSYSQRSTRYVDESEANMVVPAAVAASEEASRVWRESVARAGDDYRRLKEILAKEPHLVAIEDRTHRRKAVREAARSVLPNATETRVVMTGNLRAWRHFVRMRATSFAEPEIRKLAVEILRQLKETYQAVFADYEIVEEDGVQVARSSMTWD